MSARLVADRVVSETVAELRPGIRKISHSALTPEEQSNLRAKDDFDTAIEAAGLGNDSVRLLATFFGVKKSTLHERMSRRRTDLAPLPEWFTRLREYAEFRRLSAQFARQA